MQNTQNIDFTAYSTNEQAVGTWVNGKTIYRKTIYRSSIVAGENDIVHGISNLDLCIKAEAFETVANHTTLLFPAIVNTNGGNHMSLWTVSDTRIRLYNSLQATDLYITLYYTKNS